MGDEMTVCIGCSEIQSAPITDVKHQKWLIV